MLKGHLLIGLFMIENMEGVDDPEFDTKLHGVSNLWGWGGIRVERIAIGSGENAGCIEPRGHLYECKKLSKDKAMIS